MTHAKEIIREIRRNEFRDAIDIIESTNKTTEEVNDILMRGAVRYKNRLGFDHNKAFLMFAMYLVEAKGEASTIETTMNILLNVNTDFPGRFFLAYEYQKRLIEMMPEKMDVLAESLKFYDLPNPVMSESEAREVALTLERNGFESELGQKILKRHHN